MVIRVRGLDGIVQDGDHRMGRVGGRFRLGSLGR